MRSIGILRILPFFLLAACTSTSNQTPSFVFNPEAVDQLTLAKFDPETGQKWVTTITRSNPRSKDWEITAAPADTPLQDRRANGNYIRHLLDTLKTLHFEPNPKQGPLEAFGLQPPRFALKWRTAQNEQELLLGTSLQHSAQFALWNSTSHASQTWIATGAALLILTQLTDFQVLRDRTWTTLNSDSIDEIELSAHNQSFFYAQREGSEWTDRSHHPIRSIKPDEILRQLISTPIDTFIDQPAKAEALKLKIKKRSLYQAKLTSRLGQVTQLSLTRNGDQVIGFNSTRAGVFILPQTILTPWIMQHKK